MADKPNTTDFIVIAIWVLIGLAIIFSLFDASKIKNVELYVQLIAALATIGTVYFAYRAVTVANEELKRARADRREELLFKRPYITFVKGEMGENATKDEGMQNYIEAQFKNVGVNPAGEIAAKVIILNFDLDVEHSFVKSLANDIPSQFEFDTNMGGFYLSFPQQESIFFVLITIHYIDAILKKDFIQRFYLKWWASDGGAIKSRLYQPLKWERDRIVKVLGVSLDEKDVASHSA